MSWWILDVVDLEFRPRPLAELPSRPCDAKPAGLDPFSPYYLDMPHIHGSADASSFTGASNLGAHVQGEDLEEAVAHAILLFKEQGMCYGCGCQAVGSDSGLCSNCVEKKGGVRC